MTQGITYTGTVHTSAVRTPVARSPRAGHGLAARLRSLFRPSRMLDVPLPMADDVVPGLHAALTRLDGARHGLDGHVRAWLY